MRKQVRIIAIIMSVLITFSSISIIDISVFANCPTTWNELQEQINSGGEIVLTNDIIASENDSALNVPNNITVSIDLNGYNIDRNLSQPIENGNVITIASKSIIDNTEGTLIINDSVGTGKITGGYNLNDLSGGICSYGNLVINGGNICDNKTLGFGGGIYAASSSLTINGGNVSDNFADYDADAIGDGAGVYLCFSAKLYMNGGCITNNISYNKYGGVACNSINTTFGGPVYIINNKTVKNDVKNNSNFCMCSSMCSIKIVNALSGEIDVTPYKMPTTSGIKIVKGNGYTITESDINKIFCDKQCYYFSLTNGYSYINVCTEHEYCNGVCAKCRDIDLTNQIKMEFGAQMRLCSVSGIRFLTSFNKTVYNNVSQTGAQIEMGTLVSTEQCLNNEYDSLTLNYDGKFHEIKTSGYLKDNYIAGSIVDIQQENYNQNFVGRGYVKVTRNGETKVFYASYASMDGVNNSRSISRIACLLQEDSLAYEALSNEQKSLVDSYAKFNN